MSEFQSRVRGVVEALAEKADRRGLEALPPDEVAIVMAWWTRGVVGNGGFHLYLQFGRTLSEAAAAFHQVGLAEAAVAVHEVDRALREEDVDPNALVDQGMQAFDRFEAQEKVVYLVPWERVLDAIGWFMSGRPALAAMIGLARPGGRTASEGSTLDACGQMRRAQQTRLALVKCAGRIRPHLLARVSSSATTPLAF